MGIIYGKKKQFNNLSTITRGSKKEKRGGGGRVERSRTKLKFEVIDGFLQRWSCSHSHSSITSAYRPIRVQDKRAVPPDPNAYIPKASVCLQ